MKRKVDQSVHLSTKNLRSKLPRRKRSPISPILRSGNFTSISSQKRSSNEFTGGEQFRRVTRSFCKQREKENADRGSGEGEVELSETSCVDSCSGAVFEVSGDRNLKFKSIIGKGVEDVKEIEEISSVQKFSGKISTSGAEKVKQTENYCGQSCSGAVFEVSGERNSNLKIRIGKGIEKENEGTGEFSSVEQFSRKISTSVTEKTKQNENSLEITQNDVVSVTSALNSTSPEQKFSNITENRACEHVLVSEVSRNCAESSLKQIPMVIGVDIDLTCSEQFSCSYEDNNDNVSEYSSFLSSEYDLSGEDYYYYSPLCDDDSGSQFSEKSFGDDNNPSVMHQLLLQFSQQFCRSTILLLGSKLSSPVHEEICDQNFIMMRFEEEEEEKSYRMLRKRERRQVYLHDYTEEYCFSTDYGELVIQQRLQMVHWIVEQSINKELQKETMFLGVCLLDRFLSKGYFKTKRNLQIAGIACLTLAIRIEENQPFNSVRQKSFSAGSNVYSRCEVVAMEWLVQEVLNFQCFLPTTYNFLWFYLKAAKANPEVEKTSKYLAVLALLGHEQLCYWPSTVAAGLVILASIAANQDESCYLVTKIHSRTRDYDLPECIKSLEWLVKYIC